MFTHAETNVDTFKREASGTKSGTESWQLRVTEILIIYMLQTSNSAIIIKNNAPITNCLKYLQASASAFLGPVVF